MKNKKRTFKPEKLTVRLNERALPEIKDLEVGEETTITLKVRMTSKSQGNEYGDIDEDGDYYEREYGKDYADAKNRERSQLRGSFEILSADEDGKPNTKSAAELKADEMNAKRKRPRFI